MSKRQTAKARRGLRPGAGALVAAALLVGMPGAATSWLWHWHGPSAKSGTSAAPATASRAASAPTAATSPARSGRPLQTAAPAGATARAPVAKPVSAKPARRVDAAAPARERARVAAAPAAGRALAVAAPVSIDLCAKAGDWPVPGGGTVRIWGFAPKPAGVACDDASVVPTLPGPLLEVDAGAAVTITLYNALTTPVSLALPGQAIAPDPDGAAPGGSKAYTFTSSDPGTYLYESGNEAARQVPMGLYGALVVRPDTPGQAYAGAASAFDKQAVLVLSEIDPALNANPAGFNLLDYAPKYWLINGKAHPDTAAISAAGGQKVLLRYVNAGLQNHTMELLGMHQRVIAKDAFATTFPFDAVAETIPSGATADMIAVVPAGAAPGARFPLYNRQLRLTNGSSFPGGMLTFVTVP